MKENAEDIWSKVALEFAAKYGEDVSLRWLEPVKPMSFENRTLKVLAPDEFFASWIRTHYMSDLKEILSQKSGGEDTSISIYTPEEAPAPPKEESVRGPSPNNPAEGIPSHSVISHLNSRYTFSTFVIGSGNRFAHAASLAVAESPGKAYNPLFIYGGVGLGKTHLMQAIGRGLAEKGSRCRIFYSPAEVFTNELITAIANKTTSRFRNFYRNADVLLLDDVHFVAGKEKTQEEMFHTFNILYDARKQIVLSSDRQPKDIYGLEERLVSRFAWGLVADIQPPEFETRVAILKKRAEADGVDLNDEIAFYIASKIKANVRELEGSLIRLIAYSKLDGAQMSIDMAKEVLQNTIPSPEKEITIEAIQKKVAEHFDIRLSDMRTQRRPKSIAFPRQVAMYVARMLTDLSLPEIGEAFGGRDHTTVLYAVSKIKLLISKDEKAARLIDEILQRVKE